MEPTARQFYEHELPRPTEPFVLERVRAWVAQRRPQQRPQPALLAMLVLFPVCLLCWWEAQALIGFRLPWEAQAVLALALGFFVGRPVRNAGNLYDRRWAVLTGLLSATIATLGDMIAVLLLGNDQGEGVDRGAVLSAVFSSDLPEIARAYFAHRLPIDWVVAGLAALGAAFGTRPEITEDHVRLQARIDLLLEREAEAAGLEGAREADDELDPGRS